MSRHLRAILCVFAALILSACEARSLSMLQSDFNETVTAKVECANLGTDGDGDGGLAKCLTDFTPVFQDIASQAEEALRDSDGDAGIRVGLHRLSAVSHWQAGDPESMVASAARPGIVLCDAGASEAAPRDCALLKLVGKWVAVETVAGRIEAISTTTDACNSATELRELVDFYSTGILGPLRASTTRAKEIPGLDASVSAYFDRQVDLAARQTERMVSLAARCVGADLRGRVQSCGCPEAGLAHCVDPNTPGFDDAETYFKARCP